MERRGGKRRPVHLPQSLLLTIIGSRGKKRTLIAKIVDFSERGIGLEMFAPLSVGSVVSVDGRLRSDDLSLALKGQARVAHCRRKGRGNYRIGLALKEVAYRKSA